MRRSISSEDVKIISQERFIKLKEERDKCVEMGQGLLARIQEMKQEQDRLVRENMVLQKALGKSNMQSDQCLELEVLNKDLEGRVLSTKTVNKHQQAQMLYILEDLEVKTARVKQLQEELDMATKAYHSKLAQINSANESPSAPKTCTETQTTSSRVIDYFDFDLTVPSGECSTQTSFLSTIDQVSVSSTTWSIDAPDLDRHEVTQGGFDHHLHTSPPSSPYLESLRDQIARSHSDLVKHRNQWDEEKDKRRQRALQMAIEEEADINEEKADEESYQLTKSRIAEKRVIKEQKLREKAQQREIMWTELKARASARRQQEEIEMLDIEEEKREDMSYQELMNWEEKRREERQIEKEEDDELSKSLDEQQKEDELNAQARRDQEEELHRLHGAGLLDDDRLEAELQQMSCWDDEEALAEVRAERRSFERQRLKEREERRKEEEMMEEQSRVEREQRLTERKKKEELRKIAVQARNAERESDARQAQQLQISEALEHHEMEILIQETQQELLLAEKTITQKRQQRTLRAAERERERLEALDQELQDNSNQVLDFDRAADAETEHILLSNPAKSPPHSLVPLVPSSFRSPPQALQLHPPTVHVATPKNTSPSPTPSSEDWEAIVQQRIADSTSTKPTAVRARSGSYNGQSKQIKDAGHLMYSQLNKQNDRHVRFKEELCTRDEGHVQAIPMNEIKFKPEEPPVPASANDSMDSDDVQSSSSSSTRSQTPSNRSSRRSNYIRAPPGNASTNTNKASEASSVRSSRNASPERSKPARQRSASPPPKGIVLIDLSNQTNIKHTPHVLQAMNLGHLQMSTGIVRSLTPEPRRTSPGLRDTFTNQPSSSSSSSSRSCSPASSRTSSLDFINTPSGVRRGSLTSESSTPRRSYQAPAKTTVKSSPTKDKENVAPRRRPVRKLSSGASDPFHSWKSNSSTTSSLDSQSLTSSESPRSMTYSPRVMNDEATSRISQMPQILAPPTTIASRNSSKSAQKPLNTITNTNNNKVQEDANEITKTKSESHIANRTNTPTSDSESDATFTPGNSSGSPSPCSSLCSTPTEMLLMENNAQARLTPNLLEDLQNIETTPPTSALKSALQRAMASNKDVAIDPKLKECDGGMNELRSEVMVCNHSMSLTISRIHLSRDKERVFKNAHNFIKTVVLELISERKIKLTPGATWPITISDIRKIPEHHRTPLIRSLQEIVISYDMMPTIKRSSMITVMEVLNNAHWFVAMARFCYNSGRVPASRMPKQESQVLGYDNQMISYKSQIHSKTKPTTS